MGNLLNKLWLKALISLGLGIGSLLLFLSFPFETTGITAKVAMALVFASTLIVIIQFGVAAIKPASFAEDVISDQLQAFAQGDLTKQLAAADISALGKLGDVLLLCQKNIKSVLTVCSRTSVLSTNSARLLQQSFKSLNDAIDQSLSQLTSAAAGSEELSLTANEISKNSDSAKSRSDNASQTAREGQLVIEENIVLMGRIQSIVESSASMVNQLGERSKDIGKIVELIRGIASQTNLLALNAAIEAARAGEHGRGFAVVSDEVRKLAFETSEATDQINNTVQAMQDDIYGAIQEMQNGVQAVTKGVADSSKSGEALKNILEQVELLAADIQHINRATNDQTETTKVLSKSLHTIAGLMENAVKDLSANKEAIDKFNQSSSELKHQLANFKLVTRDDAKGMVEKAYAYLQQQGKEKALLEFSNRTGRFVDGELFILVQDYDGVMLAYGGEAPIVGKNVLNARDAKGNAIGPPMINIAKTQGSGWYQYDFLNPHSDLVEPKLSYIKAIDNTCYMACGIYLRDQVKVSYR